MSLFQMKNIVFFFNQIATMEGLKIHTLENNSVLGYFILLVRNALQTLNIKKMEQLNSFKT